MNHHFTENCARVRSIVVAGRMFFGREMHVPYATLNQFSFASFLFLSSSSLSLTRERREFLRVRNVPEWRAIRTQDWTQEESSRIEPVTSGINYRAV